MFEVSDDEADRTGDGEGMEREGEGLEGMSLIQEGEEEEEEESVGELKLADLTGFSA